MKILLVDDERLLLDSLALSLDCEKETITWVGKATDGQTALSLCREHQPDIVITDIRMSPMDGLTLTKEIKAQCPHTRVILMSSYSDFHYAQQAIALGVSAYLLKLTTTPQELAATIRRIAQELRQLASPPAASSTQSKTALTLRCMLGEATPQEQAQLFEGVADCKWIMMGAATGHDGEENPLANEKLLALLQTINPDGLNAVSTKHCYLFLPLPQGEERLRSTLIRLKSRLATELGDVSVGLSPVVEKQDIEAAYRQVKRVLARSFFEEKNSLLQWTPADQQEEDTLPAPYQDFVFDAAAGNYLLLQKKLTAFLRETERLKRIGQRHLLGMVEHVLLLLVEALSPMHDLDALMNAIHSIEHLQYLDELCHVTNWVFRQLSLSHPPASCSPVVQRCINYIMTHYEQPLSLSVLAGELSVSPAHLSKLFTNETGENITAFILRCKMEYAKGLLLHRPDLEIKQLAMQLGFDSASYFTALFRKHAGCSPTEYRKQCIQQAT